MLDAIRSVIERAQNLAVMDDANLPPMQRIKLVTELASTIEQLESAPIPKRIRLVTRASEIRVELLGGVRDIVLDTRNAEVYGHQDIRTRGARQKANDAAQTIIDRFLAGEIQQSDLSEDDRKALAGYSGTGGALKGADGKKGSAYEYYTSTPLAAGVWSALKDMGFAGGKVLDPSAGTGVFGVTAPKDAVVDSVELSKTSGTINSLLNDSDTYTTTISPFEAVAAATPDEQYDAVVTNVPFGKLADRGGNQLHDLMYQKENLETYFILRSLDKLKPGGLAAFIVPPRCTAAKGGSDRKLREMASLKAEFLGAYRLPNKVFGAAAADTITDVIFFRKFSENAAQRIAELLEQDPGKLTEAKVMWADYIDGNYFKTTEGSPHVLGEFKAKDPDKFRDVDRVENPASVPEIAKLLRKLPDTRIDWNLIASVETQPIEYRNGDYITHGGKTLQYQEGEWHVLESHSDDQDMLRLLGSCKDAYSAFEANIHLNEAEKLVAFMHLSGQSLDIPGWLASVSGNLKALNGDDRLRAWRPVVVGLATRQVLDEVGRASGTNFLAEYPELSKALMAHHASAKKLRVSGFAKQALGEIRNQYKGKKLGYSNLWRGDVQSETEVVTTELMGIDGLQYKAQSNWLDIETVREFRGGEFDPFATDDWCVSADGKQVTPVDDYYIGNYQAFLSGIDTAIAKADGQLKDKLVRQKILAEERIDKVDIGRIQFNLFSPYVTLEEKAEFLRRNVDSRAVVGINEKTGDTEIMFDIRGSKLTDREKLLKRMGYYLKTGSVSLGGAELSLPDKAGIDQLRKMVSTANEQFNGWAKASPRVAARLHEQLSDPSRLRFRQVDDETPLQIPGINTAFSPHGYQSAWVRKMARDFSGINAFGTGLGKTPSALMAAQYAQTMGVKKKTFFVLPNNVLSNWYKETITGDPASGKSPVYDPSIHAGCLFVGLREKGDGQFSVDSSLYDEDLNTVLENRHSKIFMTYEAFDRIPLKDETINGFEGYLRSVDRSFAESEDKKEDERKKGKAKTLLDILSDKPSNAPYLEDMGVDSVMIDEGQAFKNSAATVDFSGAKYLSLSEPSKRGLDAQAKCWFIRSGNDRGDGVIPLTATPLTNSPLEIYSMLSLAYGHDRINDMLGGLSGADDFMSAVCDIEDEDEQTIDGKWKAMRVFKGLNNVALLRNMLHQVASIKSAEDVGNQITVPDAPLDTTPVDLPPETQSRLQMYKDAYRFARDNLEEEQPIYDEAMAKAYETVAQHFAQHFAEPMELVAHPFNLINKMTLLVFDPDLDQRLTRYVVGSESDAARLADEWNKKKPTEDRSSPGPNATEADAKSVKTVRDSDVGKKKVYKMPVKAWSKGQEVMVDTLDWRLQDKFEALAKRLKVDLDVTMSPKLAAYLNNIQKEAANPRGIDAAGSRVVRAKQLTFCDHLSSHNKIKRLLVNKAGVPLGKIAIVTGQRNSSPDEILAIQDGFNGAGDAGKYDHVIGNRKIEVGINLQKGTQALHHLTIGWTPDSITQRDGRGVRQGNRTAHVNRYHYDANGTFDNAKRTLVDNKASWIDELMDVNGQADSIEISGGLSKEQMEALIDVMGDSDGVSKLQEALAQKEAESRASSNRSKQLINLDTIRKQNAFLTINREPHAWVGKYLSDLMLMMGVRADLRSRLANPKVTAGAEAKYTSKLAEIEPRIAGITATINAGVKIYTADYQGNKSGSPVEPEQVIHTFLKSAKRGENRAADLLRGVRRKYFGYSRWEFEINQDSDLHNEWLSEIDLAKSMRDQAVDSYEKQSSAADAMRKEVARAFAEGRGEMVGDLAIYEGCLIRSTENDDDLVVYSNGSVYGRWGGRFQTSRTSTMAPDERKGCLSWQPAAFRVGAGGSRT